LGGNEERNCRLLSGGTLIGGSIGVLLYAFNSFFTWVEP
jgi:hypothetical protein